MQLYIVAVVTGIFFVLLFLVIWLSKGGGSFFEKWAREMLKGEYYDFQKAMRPRSGPRELHSFLKEYPRSFYREQAKFEIGEKHFQRNEYHLAKEAYEEFIAEYPNSHYCEIGRAKMDVVDKHQYNNEGAEEKGA